MTIQPITRTVLEVIETSLHWMPSFGKARGKRAFQFVSNVTGKAKSTSNDYETIAGKHYGYETLTIKGSKGYIRLTLQPLFEVIS